MYMVDIKKFYFSIVHNDGRSEVAINIKNL